MCTNLLLDVPSIPGNGTTRQYISARTMELNEPNATSLYLIPKGEKFPLFPNKSSPWTGTYGFVGVAFTPTVKLPALVFMDGINQQGLSCAALWMPGTQYPASGSGTPLEFYDLCAWAMSQYATVDDLIAGLSKVSVIGSSQTQSPLHFIATDASGTSVVVEFMGGAMQVYPQSYNKAAAGVLANAPAYDWQCTNLLNYSHLNVEGPGTSTQANVPPVGGGLLGLPGDPMSASRFVRACALRQGFSLLPSNGSGWLPTPESVGNTGSTQTIVNVAMQLVQMIQATPYGTALQTPASASSPPTVGDWTLWQVARDHTNQVFYFSSAFNSVLQAVNLNSLSFSGGSVSLPQLKSISILPPSKPNWYIDVSSSLS